MHSDLLYHSPFIQHLSCFYCFTILSSIEVCIFRNKTTWIRKHCSFLMLMMGLPNFCTPSGKVLRTFHLAFITVNSRISWAYWLRGHSPENRGQGNKWNHSSNDRKDKCVTLKPKYTDSCRTVTTMVSFIFSQNPYVSISALCFVLIQSVRSKTFPFCLFWQNSFKGRRAKRHLAQLNCAFLAELMP